MESFFSVSCQHDNAQDVILDCLQQLKSAPDHYNFGFVYATDVMSSHYPELIQQCKQTTGIEHWVGTLGIGIIAPQQEWYDLPAVSIMLARFDVREFTMLPLLKNTDDLTSMKYSGEFFTNFGVIHGDPFNQQTQELIEDLQKQFDDTFLVGGLTSSRDKQYQVSDEVFTGGVSGVIFSENISVLTNLSQGCNPVGAKHTISHAKNNIVAVLDKEPALNVLMQDMKIAGKNELQNRAGEIFIGLCIPGSDKSDYTVRNLVAVDFDQNVFAINDYLTEGHQLIFCERNQQTAADDMKQMLDKISSRLEQTPKGGIYISCLARGREQFGDHSEEVKMIHNALGDFPLTGFFANGEIHHNKLYGYTGVLTLFT